MPRTPDPGTIVKVRLLITDRPGGDVYTPAMQVHHATCRPPKHCCNWWWVHCAHLESTDLPTAARNAYALAARVGVPCDALPVPK